MTRQGVAVGLLGLGLLGLGRLLGLVELYIIGAAALGVVVFGVLLVWTRRLDLDVHRVLHPPRVAAGSAARIDLELRNRSRKRSPVLRLRDDISGTRGADLLLAPLSPGASTRAAYRLPTSRRGLIEIGPVSFEYNDPLGLARARTDSGVTSELTVLPPVEAVPPVPRSITDNPLTGAEQRASWARANGDFYALRNYVVGDDLRRVHWASSARHDELMIRQDEIPWQGRLTVLLDNRRQSLLGEGLDVATSIAASVLTASRSRSDLVRLTTADGLDSGFANGNAPFDALMERLAVIQDSPHGSLRSAVAQLRRSEAGGAVVVIAGMLTTEEQQVVQSLSGRFTGVMMVRVHPSTWDASVSEPAPEPVGAAGFVVSRSHPFASQWAAAVAALTLTRR